MGAGSKSALDRPGLIPRERVVARLLGRGEPPVVALIAPAGYGKTTVLSEWDAADERQFAWIGLDERHVDPPYLVASIAGSLNEIEPIDERVFAALSAPRPSLDKVVLPRLTAALTERERPFVLVLDDVHRLQSPESLAPLVPIAEALAGRSRMALASRNEPAMPLGRMRAHQLLVEFGPRDLVMNSAEALELLRTLGVELAPGALGELLERTEGWPVALYLAALALQDADDVDAAVASFAGDDRMVVDYLRDELLAGLPEAEREFLVRTSVLDRLSGPVCDAMLEQEGSSERLRELSRSNLLLMPLDRRDHEYRYHSLLRRMLRSELARTGAHPEAELHASASRWYAGQSDFDTAIPHAISAGDPASAGDLIWTITADYVSRGREATLRRWVERFTPEQIAATPSLSLAYATSFLSRGDGDAVEHWTTAAVSAAADAPVREREPVEIAAATIAQTGAAREGMTKMAEKIARAYPLLPEDSPWRSLCCFVEGTAHQLQGERERARSLLNEATHRGAVGAPAVRMVSLAQLALLSWDEGDLDAAADFARQALDGLVHYGLIEDASSALVFAVSALMRANRGFAGKATRDVKDSTRLLATFIDFSPWYEAETRIVLARALILLDDVAGARAHLADAARNLRQAPDATVLSDWLRQAWGEADAASVDRHWPLTAAELRLLHLLPTHLSFREIAERFVVSTNTVKTQARSIYRKMDVASRAEAVAAARAAGLLDETKAPEALAGR